MCKQNDAPITRSVTGCRSSGYRFDLPYTSVKRTPNRRWRIGVEMRADGLQYRTVTTLLFVTHTDRNRTVFHGRECAVDLAEEPARDRFRHNNKSTSRPRKSSGSRCFFRPRTIISKVVFKWTTFFGGRRRSRHENVIELYNISLNI